MVRKTKKKRKKKNTPKFHCKSEAQKRAIRANYAKRKNKSVPVGRTLMTNDNYLESGKKTGSTAQHSAVVIETNKRNELAIVTLSGHPGKNKTQLKNYQQGNSYFKHFVEVKDDEGNPIVINHKFRENHENQDVSKEGVEIVRNMIFNHVKQSGENLSKISKFRK